MHQIGQPGLTWESHNIYCSRCSSGPDRGRNWATGSTQLANLPWSTHLYMSYSHIQNTIILQVTCQTQLSASLGSVGSHKIVTKS